MQIPHRIAMLVLGALFVVACSSDPSGDAGETVTGAEDVSESPEEESVGAESASEEPTLDEPAADAESTESTPTTLPGDPDDSAVTYLDLVLTKRDLSDLIRTAGPDLDWPSEQAAEAWLIVQVVGGLLDERGIDPSGFEDAARAEIAVEFPDDGSAFVELIVTLRSQQIALEADIRGLAESDGSEPPEMLCSSHILLDTEAEAQTATDRARAGEVFAELAIELSTGPSGPNGGDLGCSVTAAYVPEYSDGARGTGVGISAPVQSQFGWHVIEVRSIGPATAEVHPEATPAELDAAVAGLREDAITVGIGEFNNLIFDTLAAQSDAIVIDPAVGVWDGENAVVLPPAG